MDNESPWSFRGIPPFVCLDRILRYTEQTVLVNVSQACRRLTATQCRCASISVSRGTLSSCVEEGSSPKDRVRRNRHKRLVFDVIYRECQVPLWRVGGQQDRGHSIDT